jgi:hypothetical protein
MHVSGALRFSVASTNSRSAKGHRKAPGRTQPSRYGIIHVVRSALGCNAAQGAYWRTYSPRLAGRIEPPITRTEAQRGGRCGSIRIFFSYGITDRLNPYH